MSDAKELKEKLFYKNKNAYNALDDQGKRNMQEFSRGYMDFINSAKTEREAVKYAVREAIAHGYKEYRFGDKIETGGKYYFDNRGKSIYLFRIGSELSLIHI